MNQTRFALRLLLLHSECSLRVPLPYWPLWSATFVSELGMSFVIARRYTPMISELMFVVTKSSITFHSRMLWFSRDQTEASISAQILSTVPRMLSNSIRRLRILQINGSPFRWHFRRPDCSYGSFQEGCQRQYQYSRHTITVIAIFSIYLGLLDSAHIEVRIALATASEV
jgi:hypothetical protein